MRITLFILAVLLAVGARAQIQQNHFTTNKVSSGTGLTNVFTGTNALGARIYQLRMDVAAGPGVTLSTNGSQITFTAAGAGLGDVTGPTGATNLADQTVNVVFVNEGAGTEDLHLGSSDTSGVKDATSDQSSGLFSDDIDYVTRSGSWDIGADEYVAAATSAG